MPKGASFLEQLGKRNLTVTNPSTATGSNYGWFCALAKNSKCCLFLN